MRTVEPAELLQAARAAQANAHAPYSRYRVGAALATPDGRVFAGCNVEKVAARSPTSWWWATGRNSSPPVATAASASANSPAPPPACMRRGRKA